MVTAAYTTYPDVTIAEHQHVMMKNIFEKYNDAGNCPVRNILDRFGDKWSTLVLLILSESEVLRFNEIHKYISTVSQKMLSVTLKTLEADGLVKRTVYPEVPPRVEYALTKRGKSLIPHIRGLVKWANTHFDEITATRSAYEKQLK